MVSSRLMAAVALAAVTVVAAPASAATKSPSRNAAVSAKVSENSASAQDFILQEAQRLEKKTRPSVRAQAKPPRAERRSARRQVSVPVQEGRAAAIDIPQVRETRKTASRSTSSRSAPAAGTPALRDLVARHAAAHGVPLGLAHGVVMVESRYNARATGPGGYIGLMQLSYRTAKGMGYTGSRAGLYDPDTNLRYGMKYLGGALKLAGGSTCGAVSKYQGGHGVKGVTRAGAVYCSKVRRHMAAMPAGTKTQSSQIAANTSPKS